MKRQDVTQWVLLLGAVIVLVEVSTIYGPDVIRYALAVGATAALIEIAMIVGVQTLIGMTRSQSLRFVALAFALASIIVGSIRFLGQPANWNLVLNTPVVAYSLLGLWQPARARTARRAMYGEAPYPSDWDGVERRRTDRRSHA